MEKTKRVQKCEAPVKGAAAPPLPPPNGYDECQGEIAVRMGHFFVRYLSRLYREFDGDLALVIVLEEIAHHNISQFYSAQGPLPGTPQAQWSKPELYARLAPCNAFSLSTATGIPRETVRRKIATLVKRGWLKRNAKGEVVIAPAVAPHFQADFNVQLLGELLELSEQLKTVLASAIRSKLKTT